MIEIYTDGACSQNGTWDGGWGLVVVENKEEVSRKYGSQKQTTNNQMELTAMIEALKIAKELHNEVSIYTDSAYIVNAFTQNWIGNWQRNGWRNAKKQPVANKELWIELITLYNASSAKIIKVKGHAGDHFNEIADDLAVLGREEA